MKLASLSNGRPDGHLVVVSKRMEQCVAAGRIAPTLQAALDNWEECAPKLEALGRELDAGRISGQPFVAAAALAPLPRAYQWIDGAGYLAHLERVRSLAGSLDTQLQSERPLLYQGGSDHLSAATAPILVPDDALAVDFEAEIAVICGPVRMGAGRDEAAEAIRLVTLCNDVSLRRLVADDLQNGFGFFHSKPATAFAPVVVTPDELGEMWRDNRLHARLRVEVNGTRYGQLDTGRDVQFDFADLISEAARTRALGAGTIVGSGTVANRHEETLPIKSDGVGFGCIAEARTAEKAKFGKARTPFLKTGDRVRIIAHNEYLEPLFGVIDQQVAVP